MGMVDQAVINFACYEDAKDFLGLASVTLPDVDFIVATVSGAGIAGNVEAPIIGHMNAMTAQLKFRTFSAESLKLLEPREHNIDLRAPQQVYDPIAGVYKTQSVKHVLVLVPKTLSNGNIAPASPTDGSGSYAVRRWVTYIDDAKVMELDPYNYICEVNGVDYFSDTRKALGKS